MPGRDGSCHRSGLGREGWEVTLLTQALASITAAIERYT
jgi:hypothetical protein